MGFLDKLKGTAKQGDVTLNGIAEGGRIVVTVDPDDPQALLVWGAAG